ncbi:hypothetical protein C8Q78DRAFT_59301 [Trametes maxima]|nr:hypothetical protein C8Q78DRAFT_59301 [Trametes maxima]
MDLPQQMDSDRTGSETAHTSIFSTARRRLSRTSIGSLFASSHATLQQDVQDTFGDPRQDVAELSQGRPPENAFAIKLPNTTNSRSGPGSSVRRSRASSTSISSKFSFSDVKQTVSNLAARGRARSASLTSPLPTASLGSFSGASGIPTSSRCVADSFARKQHEKQAWIEAAATVPLFCVTTMPSSAHNGAIALPTSPGLLSPDGYFPDEYNTTGTMTVGEDEDCTGTYDDTSFREAIRRGKQARYRLTSNSGDALAFCHGAYGTASRPTSSRVSSDSGVWYGLEYALEISKTPGSDLMKAETYGGEYSKSRRAWEALHNGSVEPARGEDEYERWKAWHECLEREEMSCRRDQY